MNLNNQPNIDQLAHLFASRKDSHDDHILWISENGEVRLEGRASYADAQDFSQAKPGLCRCLAMYRRGQGYTGKKAAADKAFLGDVLQTLQTEWEQLQPAAEPRYAQRYN